jgi:CDP-diacylglycerol--glycerol-3-phosphate 3-phosphatidyltransferase
MTAKKRSEIWKAPNILSLFRIICVPFFLMFLLQRRAGPALAVFIIASCTDFLDGLIARTLNLTTKLGKFLDPAGDKLLMAASYITLSITTLGFANTIPIWLTAAVFGRDLYIVGCAFILFKKIQKKVIHVLLLGKITTVFQMGVIFLVLFYNTLDQSPRFLLWLYVTTALLTVLSGFGYARQGEKMLKEHRPDAD